MTRILAALAILIAYARRERPVVATWPDEPAQSWGVPTVTLVRSGDVWTWTAFDPRPGPSRAN